MDDELSADGWGAGQRSAQPPTPLPLGYLSVSLTAYLAFVLVANVPDLLGPRLVMDTPLEGTGWDPWFQIASLLVPVAVTPLALVSLEAPVEADGRAVHLVSIGMLAIFAGGLWIPEQVGQGPSMGLPGYLLAVAAGLASILLIRRLGQDGGWAATDRVAWRSGPAWLLVGGALAYGMPGAGVLAWPAVGAGLLCLVAGTAWGRATGRLHPSPPVRRGLIGGGLCAVSILLLPTALLGWCLSTPLVYLLLGPAILSLVVLGIPAGSRSGGAYRALAWFGGLGAALCLLVVLLGQGGTGPLALCS